MLLSKINDFIGKNEERVNSVTNMNAKKINE